MKIPLWALMSYVQLLYNISIYLVPSEDSERFQHLFSGIGVSCFAGHEIKKSLEGNISCAVWIHDCHDPCEFSLSFLE